MVAGAAQQIGGLVFQHKLALYQKASKRALSTLN